MFTIEDLFELKEEVTKDLEADLRITKILYAAEIGFTDKDLYPYPDMLQLRIGDIITLKPGIVDMSQLTMGSPACKEVGAYTKLEGKVEPTYHESRYDRVKEISFSHHYYIPLKSVPEPMIKEQTKKRLTKRFMPEGKNMYTFSFDCKLLEQFKLGALTMQQVVDGSLGGCDL